MVMENVSFAYLIFRHDNGGECTGPRQLSWAIFTIKPSSGWYNVACIYCN